MIRTSCKSVLALLLLLVGVTGIHAQDLVIETVEDDEIAAAQAEGSIPEVGSIYDVYRQLDDDGIYRDFVDSVYVRGVSEAGEVQFRSVWRGGGKYLMEGDVLVYTGRSYEVREDRVVALGGTESQSRRAGLFLGASTGAHVAFPFDSTTDTGTLATLSGSLSVLISDGASINVTVGATGLTGISVSGFEMFAGYTIFRIAAESELTLDVGAFGGGYTDNGFSAIALGGYSIVTWYPPGWRFGLEAGLRPFAFVQNDAGTVDPASAEPAFAVVDGTATFWDIYVGAAYRFRRMGRE